MKWFTQEWYDEYVDPKTDPVVAAYKQHVQAIRESLPRGLRMLSEAGGSISLHDGWFTRIPWTGPKAETLEIDVAAWHYERGVLHDNGWRYPLLHVRLVYRDCEMLQPTSLQDAKHRQPLNLPDGPEILYGEVDLLPNGDFEHRLQLWPESSGEFAVRFKDFDIVIVAFDEASVEIIEPAQPA